MLTSQLQSHFGEIFFHFNGLLTKLTFLSGFFRFFDDPGYKEYLESAASFNRKLNEERKMRLPYVRAHHMFSQTL